VELTIEVPNDIQMKELTFVEYVQGIKNVQNQHAYYNLRNDLIDKWFIFMYKEKQKLQKIK
jgi:hypothetical protein